MCVNSEVWLCGFSLLVAVFLRLCTSLHPYSGQNKPPMFGDYEAQRHWMEITINLPLKHWYQNTSENNLQYWGLDYPPLTAYHSYLCGAIASVINSDYIKLHASRGYESEEHKIFMRYTVLFADLFLYLPSIILYFLVTSKIDNKLKSQKMYISPHFAIILSIFYPGIILIDHGHFQYNCVSLAFLIFAVTCIYIYKFVLASIFFCLALNYKQMELYHSLPFFVYLLSACVPKPGQATLSGIMKLVKISVTVLLTFIIIWAPFLYNIENTYQVLHRLFPVARGIFEDKVANFWCTLNIFYKIKIYFDNQEMFRYCLIMTLLTILPSSIDLFLRPNVKKFIPALINSSLSFFLFSFHVHEKTILLVAIPVMLYIQSKPFSCVWFLIISVLSMFPLIVKDQLITAFIALNIFYVITLYTILKYNLKSSQKFVLFIPHHLYIVQIVSDLRKSRSTQVLFSNLSKSKKDLYNLFKFIAFSGSLLGYIVLMLLMLVCKPPAKYPDIFPLLISAYSCFHFIGFFIYFNIVQFKIPQAVEDIRYIKAYN